MKFLTPDEIPETEKERRRGIQDAIDTYQAYIDQERKKFEPEINRAIAEGQFDKEKFLRQACERRVAQFRNAQALYQKQLPPYMEYGESGHLVAVAVTPEMLANPNG